jgi:radical SAM protein with 4Fe4S-binding SPASM domain
MKPLGIRQAFTLLPRSRDILSELTVITTSVCNMRCRHCFMIDELNKRSEELTVEDMSRMASHMPKMRRVHLGGGEPFAKPDIVGKALVAANEWQSKVVCIRTNGWYTQHILETIRAFGEGRKGHLRIHFSINTLPDEWDAFTGVRGSYVRWRESIREAIALANRYDNTTVLCLATYNDDSGATFFELKNFVVDEIQPHDFSMQLAREHDKYHPHLDTDKFDEVARDYFRNDSTQPWFLTAYRELVREHTSRCKNDRTRTPRCSSGISRLVIAPNGDVYPCENKGYPNGKHYSDWLMGNVRDFDLNIVALMQSPRARSVRERMASEECRCEHGIDIALNLLCSTPTSRSPESSPAQQEDHEPGVPRGGWVTQCGRSRASRSRRRPLRSLGRRRCACRCVQAGARRGPARAIHCQPRAARQEQPMVLAASSRHLPEAWDEAMQSALGGAGRSVG